MGPLQGYCFTCHGQAELIHYAWNRREGGRGYCRAHLPKLAKPAQPKRWYPGVCLWCGVRGEVDVNTVCRQCGNATGLVKASKVASQGRRPSKARRAKNQRRAEARQRVLTWGQRS